MTVSVLVLTLNEEVNIDACLESLAWCDDIVVLDSLSTDRTRAIAAERGARGGLCGAMRGGAAGNYDRGENDFGDR